MKKLKKQKTQWLAEPEEHDYPAAKSYLNLFFDDQESLELSEKLKKVSIVHFKAKDVFRASKLSLLGVSNSHVKKNIAKILKGKKMSPILLVRDTKNIELIIADGYHRMCAVYHFDEDALI